MRGRFWLVEYFVWLLPFLAQREYRWACGRAGQATRQLVQNCERLWPRVEQCSHTQWSVQALRASKQREYHSGGVKALGGFWKIHFWKTGFLEIRLLEKWIFRNPVLQNWILEKIQVLKSGFSLTLGLRPGGRTAEPSSSQNRPEPSHAFSPHVCLSNLSSCFSLCLHLSLIGLLFFLFAIVLKGGRELTAANLSG